MTASFPSPFLLFSSPTVWCGMSAVHLPLEVFSHSRTLRRTHRHAHMEHTVWARHTRPPPYRGKVSALASAMNNWVIWLRAEIAISPHKCENITRHPRPGNWHCHVGLHVHVCVFLFASMLVWLFFWVVFFFFACKRFKGGIILKSSDVTLSFRMHV